MQIPLKKEFLMLKLKTYRINIILLKTLLLFLICLLNIGLIQGELKLIYGELGLIEILQISFLLLGITITFRKESY